MKDVNELVHFMSKNTKRGLDAFVGYLKSQRESFRSDRLRTSCDWNNAESEFRTIKQRTDPLIKSLGMPLRDTTGRRQERLAGRPPAIQKHVETRCEIVEPQITTKSVEPWTVIQFSGEKYTHFNAKAMNTHVGRSYPSAFSRLKNRRHQTKL